MGLTAGIISAVKKYSLTDVLVTLSTSILVALPVFWLGMLLQELFAIKFKDWGLPHLPVSGKSSANVPQWAHLILPAFTLAAISTAYAARIMRSQLLEVLGQDYIRTAVAKGYAAGAVLRRHALKNALIPVVTFIGLDFGALMSGAILTETIFNWPGVGYDDLPGDRATRLAGGHGWRRHHRDRGHDHQPAGRHQLRVPGSPDPVRRDPGVGREPWRRSIDPMTSHEPPLMQPGLMASFAAEEATGGTQGPAAPCWATPCGGCARIGWPSSACSGSSSSSSSR